MFMNRGYQEPHSKDLRTPRREWDTGARLVCAVCAATVDLDVEPLMDRAQQATDDAGFPLHGYRLDLGGVCQQCSQPT